jgi:predicted dehydrogenase
LKRKVRVGIIGLGHVAQVCHLPGYKYVDVIEVVAGSELREDVLRRVSSKWGFRGYCDYVEMLDEEELDIVCVTTGPRYTREVTEMAAVRGINVLVEKPMALTLEDAKAMIEKCREGGVKLCYGETFRFFPTFRRAKEMIDGGILGDLQLLLETSIGGQGLKNFQPYAIYKEGDPASGPMGLTDHGIHLIDVFRWLAKNEVEWVFGRGNRVGQPPATEFLIMKFHNGAIGQLVYNEATYPSDMPYEGIFSWGSYFAGGISSWEPHPGNIRIYGTEGALRIFPYANKMFLFNEEGKRQIRVQNRPHPAHFGLQIESFAKRLLRREEPEVTGTDGLRALQIIQAVYESFENKRIIPIKPVMV